jgi:hypothetical protein
MNPTPLSLENQGDGRTGADSRIGAFAHCASVFMSQMFAQHGAFAFFAVRLKLPMHAVLALTLPDPLTTIVFGGRRQWQQARRCDWNEGGS